MHIVLQDIEVEELKTKERDPGRVEFRVKHSGEEGKLTGLLFSCWETSDLNSAPVERLTALCAGALNFCL